MSIDWTAAGVVILASLIVGVVVYMVACEVLARRDVRRIQQARKDRSR